MGEAKNAIKRNYIKEKGKWLLVDEYAEFIRDLDVFFSYCKPLKAMGGIERTERKGVIMQHTSISPDRLQKSMWEWRV